MQNAVRLNAEDAVPSSLYRICLYLFIAILCTSSIEQSSSFPAKGPRQNNILAESGFERQHDQAQRMIASVAIPAAA